MPIAANTLALWRMENDALDSSGNGNALTNTGSVPFSNTTGVALGTYSAGPFAAGKYLSENAVFNAMKGATGWTLEGYFYLPNAAGSQYVIYVGKDVFPAGPFEYTALYIGGSKAQLIINDASRVTWATTLTNNTLYYFAIVSTGSNSIDFYCSPAASISQSKVGTYSAAGAGTWPNPATAGHIVLGAQALDYVSVPLTGYLDQVRVSNVARTSFPTVDITGSSMSSCFMRRRRR